MQRSYTTYINLYYECTFVNCLCMCQTTKLEVGVEKLQCEPCGHELMRRLNNPHEQFKRLKNLREIIKSEIDSSENKFMQPAFKTRIALHCS
ncbi:CLUMA_CG013124, isoform A [Clunio marinus]|uniref:CLUMA_CG013124, isoform A n=1 Tax=Clunio marinus TaxID=568069 RepID=A0A1J1IHZ0_9DIPT|nr:CLUMA_CG013124, isoform A [Clunio marinus]